MMQDTYTNIGIGDTNIIVQKLYKPKEIKISINSKDVPMDNEVDCLVSYLGAEVTAMLGVEIEMANKYNILDGANNQPLDI